MTKKTRQRLNKKTTANDTPRSKVLLGVWYLLFTIVLGRLFYWQVIRGNALQAAAESQYSALDKITFSRGRIFTADNYLLVGNQTVYRLFLEPKLFTQNPESTAQQITPLLLDDYEEYTQATDSAVRETLAANIEQTLSEKLAQTDKSWVLLKSKISDETRQKLSQQNISGLGFDPYEVRYYPEASMAAHVTGFVGKNEDGQDTGYFGIEGALDKELQGRTIKTQAEKDAFGLNLFFSQPNPSADTPGRDVVLTIKRDIQSVLEAQLKKGVEQYGAQSGEIIVMEPKTGKILGLAAYPHYDQAHFYDYDPSLYKNPALANTYEPGSTFKTLTVSAGINEGVITPDTECPICTGPIQIGQYQIKTWNQVYNPNITMTGALEKSDNTAMVYVARLLGKEKFIEYLHRFKIGDEIHIDLQEDTTTPMRQKWGDIDLATNSFGQGISTNSLQMVRAVGTIANQGIMVRPTIIEKVVEPSTQKEMIPEAIAEGEVISAQTAKTVTEMMIASAAHGEAQWVASKTYNIAGKTGTSQVPIEGGYDPTKTIASFIGFAPAYDPKFVMLVKLNEPSTSPWAAETAAPLWYDVANKLFLLMDIQPDK